MNKAAPTGFKQNQLLPIPRAIGDLPANTLTLYGLSLNWNHTDRLIDLPLTLVVLPALLAVVRRVRSETRVIWSVQPNDQCSHKRA